MEQNAAWLSRVYQTNDPRAVSLMSHILLSEKQWLNMLEHGDRTSVYETLTLKEASELFHDNAERIKKQLDDLDSVHTIKSENGEEGNMTVEEVFVHLSLHAVHHQGQLASLWVGRDIPSVKTDFASFSLSFDMETDE